METFGKITLGIIFIVLSTIFGGFVFAKFWAWFIIPIFALPALTITQAIGVTMVTRLATLHTIWQTEKDIGFVERCLSGFFFYTILLFFGWIVQLFL
jgi:hypothetical protein